MSSDLGEAPKQYTYRRRKTDWSSAYTSAAWNLVRGPVSLVTWPIGREVVMEMRER